MIGAFIVLVQMGELSVEPVYSTVPGFFILVGFALCVRACNWRSKHLIRLTESGIIFDKIMRYGLLDRLHREWSDVHAVDFQGHCRPKNIAEWSGLGDSSLTIDFKSGGSVQLDLDALSRSTAEELLLSLERFSGQEVFSKNALLFERAVMAVDSNVPITYETIWTDALDSQFGATIFVPLTTGARLQGERYEVRMQLASGGLSAVYLAGQTGGRKVVLKESTLPADISEAVRSKAKELFEREARLLARIEHPRITKVLDHFVEAGRDYIVLEFIPGMSLRQLVELKGQQPPRKVLRWAVQIVEVLHYLHHLEPAIVHRDLTPDNLIIKSDESIALIDFGVSNEFVSVATGTLVGKQAYIPPEQIRGKAEPKSDIYAFGATLYFLLVGQDPEPLSVSRAAQALPGVPAEFDELIAACTQLENEDRPDSRHLVEICRELMAR